MEIFTIGFTRTTAEDFFGRLKSHRVERLLDVRLNNRSQLAGFAKRDDLRYFLRELVGASYEHAPLLAPTQEILDEFKKRKEIPWGEYEERFLTLLREREVENELRPEDFSRRTWCSPARRNTEAGVSPGSTGMGSGYVLYREPPTASSRPNAESADVGPKCWMSLALPTRSGRMTPPNRRTFGSTDRPGSCAGRCLGRRPMAGSLGSSHKGLRCWETAAEP